MLRVRSRPLPCAPQGVWGCSPTIHLIQATPAALDSLPSLGSLHVEPPYLLFPLLFSRLNHTRKVSAQLPPGHARKWCCTSPSTPQPALLLWISGVLHHAVTLFYTMLLHCIVLHYYITYIILLYSATLYIVSVYIITLHKTYSIVAYYTILQITLYYIMH